MRLYLRLILEKQGFEVKEAADLREARSYLHAGNRPTSVLLDLELPDGHGLDILRELPVGVPVVRQGRAAFRPRSIGSAIRGRAGFCDGDAALCCVPECSDRGG